MTIYSKDILFLGYSEEETILIEKLREIGCKVDCFKDEGFDIGKYDLVISFGYRNIIKKELISKTIIPIINLHISYLPWNRGSHPNFWSFFDSTPSGVSIHMIDDGIDTGPIIFQKYVDFDKNEITFTDTYKRLISEIEQLFLSNINDIINGNYSLKPQRGSGSYHKKSQLPKEFNGWDSNIVEEINRLNKIL